MKSFEKFGEQEMSHLGNKPIPYISFYPVLAYYTAISSINEMKWISRFFNWESLFRPPFGKQLIGPRDRKITKNISSKAALTGLPRMELNF